MTTEVTVATAFSGGNIVLLGLLSYVWLQNYRRFRTPLVLGLLVFGLVFMLENLVAVYFFFAEEMLYGYEPIVHRVMVALRGLQFLALLSLAYVTMK
ncbi:hypothetical protein [Natrarchaeobius oligotrophus]|uniref:Uncharacterized protein n=1 Tax=Natrarchaeobius chitinivorans TaxID=1679083 RepID=A0A3N6MVL2_NATCH|nr:hypothetical protein [Natrarchaeobius chitinivorans]RQH02011.1 hypothetical protein EA472_06870 [Natrarchaeobius chitinivorans]